MKQPSVLCRACHLAATAAHLPTEKLCRQCNRTLPMSAFDLRKSSQGAAKWRSSCKECINADQRARAALRAKTGAPRDRSGERAAVPYLGLRKYARDLGIPWAQVVERYPADNRCEICRRTPKEAYPSGRFVRLSLDHDHLTGELRGFLCGPCNAALGQLGDNRARIRKALEYLLRFEKSGGVAAERALVLTLF
jgi:Recombination endonuclease VII